MLQIQPVLAQNDSSMIHGMHMELEEVEAFSERSAELFPEFLRQLQTVPRKLFKQYSSHSLNDILDQQPGIDIRTRGAHGIQSDLSILGGSFDQSLVLINGIDFSDPQSGHFNLDLPFLPSTISKVEILKGPASKKYGSQAFTGAVNFVSTPGDSLELKADVNFGQYQTNQFSANITIPTGSFRTGFSVYRSASKGYIYNTDYINDGLFLHSVWDLKNIQSEFIFGANSKDFGANAFYTPRFPDQYEETSSMLGAFKLKVNRHFHANINWRRHYDHFLLFRDNPSYYENFHTSDILGSSLGTSVSSKLGVTHARLLFRFEQIYSTSLGSKLDIPKTINKQSGKDFSYYSSRKNLSIGADHTISAGKISLNLGLLLSTGISHLSLPGLYPGLDLAWKLNNALTIFSSVNRSRRLPTFTDLYYQGPQNIGNPELVPEKAWTIQEGLSFNKGLIESSLQFYYRKGNEVIDWIWKDSIWQTENLTELNSYGAEIITTVFPQKNNTGSKIQQLTVSYAYTDVTKTNPDLISNYALDYLKHKFVFNIQLAPFKNVYAGINYRLQDRNGTFSYFESPESSPVEKEYQLFHLFDVKAGYSFQRVSLFIDVSNLFNTEYRDIGSVVMPGRWVMLGITLSHK